MSYILVTPAEISDTFFLASTSKSKRRLILTLIISVNWFRTFIRYVVNPKSRDFLR